MRLSGDLVDSHSFPTRRSSDLDLAGSIEPLRALLVLRPDDAEANFLYGRALALTEQPGLATWSLRKAMQDPQWLVPAGTQDRKSTRLNSSHLGISYAVFCLKKK